MKPSQTELDHHYGPQVHLIDSPLLSGLLARLCSAECLQPEINHLVEVLYTHLIATAINSQFEQESFTQATRMTEHHPDIMLSGKRISPSQKAVTVNLARAGTQPSQICYNYLHWALAPQNIRQDHIFAARVTNNTSQVTGTDFGAMKIGGGVKEAYVIFPDPMGATGNTMVTAISHYKQQVPGPAKKYICLHLIVTPEYLRNLQSKHPEVVVYALRLDRGLSSQAALDAMPGKFWAEEKGLNETHYIVPGGGGFGEIMNNSFI